MTLQPTPPRVQVAVIVRWDGRELAALELHEALRWLAQVLAEEGGDVTRAASIVERQIRQQARRL